VHLIDTHAHLDYSDFDADRDLILRRARDAEVAEIITIGTRVDSSAAAVKLASAHPGVWCTVGVHPSEAGEAGAGYLDEIRKLCSVKRVVAIGEIGLDYHRLPSQIKPDPLRETFAATVSQDPLELRNQIEDDAYKNAQALVFREQLDLAVELGLNIVVHQRDAWEDTLSILDEYRGQVRGVFHCFGGAVDQARELVALGHLISFTGIVTFKNAKQVQETARLMEPGTFMVETDCPYLAPHPHRGQRCEPSHTRLVAEKIAELRGTTVQRIAEQTTATAREFFRFNP
jgi:TatD DNase family protein